MAYFPIHQQQRTLAEVAVVLDQINGSDLADALDRRFDEPPPSYSSGESTQLWSPSDRFGELDDAGECERNERRRACFQAAPGNMFELQTARERQRLPEQVHATLSGRKATLPFEKSSDLTANAENNIRSFWIEQGIWEDTWAPAWPPDSHPFDNRWLWKQSRPIRRPRPRGPWKHEQRAEPAHNKQMPSYSTQAVSRESGNSIANAMSAQSTQASRPYYQFMSQMARERQWIKDEIEWANPESFHTLDLDALAKESVERMWKEDGLWRLQWNNLPGMAWAYEDLPGPIWDDEFFKRLREEDERTNRSCPDSENAVANRHISIEKHVKKPNDMGGGPGLFGWLPPAPTRPPINGLIFGNAPPGINQPSIHHTNSGLEVQATNGGRKEKLHQTLESEDSKDRKRKRSSIGTASLKVEPRYNLRSKSHVTQNHLIGPLVQARQSQSVLPTHKDGKLVHGSSDSGATTLRRSCRLKEQSSYLV